MFPHWNGEYISREDTSVFDTDVTALRVAAHILTVTEFLGRFRFTTALKSGVAGAQVTVLSSGL